MFGWVKRLFGGSGGKDEAAAAEAARNEEAARAWYERKTKLLAETLGEEHDMVMHAIVPFAMGGGLDLYYYPKGIEGLGVATKELCELPDEGSTNDAWDNYELVMFTKHALVMEDAKDVDTTFGRMHMRMNAILNIVAAYSGDVPLNPNETCEFPEDTEDVGGACLILAEYGVHTDSIGGQFGIMLVMEVFRSEMEYAREEGTEELIALLQARGAYPYSDMAREAVV